MLFHVFSFNVWVKKTNGYTDGQAVDASVKSIQIQIRMLTQGFTNVQYQSPSLQYKINYKSRIKRETKSRITQDYMYQGFKMALSCTDHSYASGPGSTISSVKSPKHKRRRWERESSLWEWPAEALDLVTVRCGQVRLLRGRDVA